MKLIRTCPICKQDYERNETPDTLTNEVLIMRAFVSEFHPFYSPDVDNFNYFDLVDIIKEIVEEF